MFYDKSIKKMKEDTVISIEVDTPEDVEIQKEIEFAFSIDHILENILSNLDLEDLKNSRLVTHRWSQLGAKQLQKLVSINFSQVQIHQSTQSNFFSLHSSKEREPLENLHELMNISTEFPCKTFKFFLGNLNVGNIQDFLNTHGSHIQKLELHLNYFSDWENKPNSHFLFTQLRNLIVNQVPNVKYLKLQIESDHLWGKSESEKENDFDCEESQNQNSKNFKLKYLKFMNGIPLKFFQNLLSLAPNLIEVKLPVRYLHYFLAPISNSTNSSDHPCLHLLKNLVFLPHQDNLDFLEKLVGNLNLNSNSERDSKIQNPFRVQNQNQKQKQFQLRKLSLNFEEIYCQPELWYSVACILNTIFEKSAPCLEKIVLEPLRFLEIVKLPKMCKLKEVQFINSYYNGIPEQHFFPKNTKVKEIFPKLKRICLDSTIVISSEVNFDFENNYRKIYFDDENFNPVCDSVQRLTAARLVLQSEKCLEELRQWFPNAKIVGIL